jgi:hypothetical protein
MIRLKNILLEQPEKSDAENPDKMLVVSKKSGKSYYINKANFDPSLHTKPEPKEKKTEKPEEPKGEKSVSKSSDGEPSKEKKDDSGKEKSKEEPKKLSPSEKLEKKLGSFVFVDEKEKEEIANDAKSLRPDLKEKLLKFEFTSFFREYDNLLDQLASQTDSGDKEGAKQTVVAIRKTAKRVQGIAIAKLAALSNFTNDDEVITAAKYYHQGSNTLNDFLRSGGQISWSKEDLEDMIKKTPDPKNMIPTKYMMYTVLTLDNHFKTSGAILQNDTVVYRGVQDKVLQKFVESGEWVDNGFVSTSLNPIIAEDFYSKNYQTRGMAPIFEIKLKRGSKVLMLPCSEDEYCIESEITLPRGCSFKIEEHDKEKNVYKVSVEMPNA